MGEEYIFNTPHYNYSRYLYLPLPNFKLIKMLINYELLVLYLILTHQNVEGNICCQITSIVKNLLPLGTFFFFF